MDLAFIPLPHGRYQKRRRQEKIISMFITCRHSGRRSSFSQERRLVQRFSRLAAKGSLILVLAASPQCLNAKESRAAKQVLDDDQLDQLSAEHFVWLQKERPSFARQIGNHAYDTELDDHSANRVDRRARDAAEFRARLDAIIKAGIPEVRRIDARILRDQLTNEIETARYGQSRWMISPLLSFWQSFTVDIEQSRFRNRNDVANYLVRLEKFPDANDAQLAVALEGADKGYAMPCSILPNFIDSVRSTPSTEAKRSRFVAPFDQPRPADISEEEWQALRAEAISLIATRISPAFGKAASILQDRYGSKCAQRDSISSQPDGAAYYRFLVRQETTTDLTPEEIHSLGLREVARIGALMDALAREAGFTTRQDYITKLKADPASYARTPEELIAAAAHEAKRIDGLMPGFFNRLPRLPYGLRAVPENLEPIAPTAYYHPGSEANGTAGFYYINSSKLDQRPLWELPALTAHEAVPGHHHQIALQQELDVTPLRQHYALFAAFAEGWGLYAERIGEDMGLYDTPAKRMGQLSYEMWRACRLVIDTGIHAKAWDKADAIAYLSENTALSDVNVAAEINRYIARPAQALAYKIGELKIIELRERAQNKLGPRFDLATFHDAVLMNGSLPLDLLDQEMARWIERQRAGAAQFN